MEIQLTVKQLTLLMKTWIQLRKDCLEYPVLSMFKEAAKSLAHRSTCIKCINPNIRWKETSQWEGKEGWRCRSLGPCKLASTERKIHKILFTSFWVFSDMLVLTPLNIYAFMVESPCQVIWYMPYHFIWFISHYINN